MQENEQTKAGLASELINFNQENQGPAKVKQNTAALVINEMKEWYNCLFNNISDAVFVNEWNDKTNWPGNFTEVNDAACEKLGFTKDVLLHMSPSEIDKHYQDIYYKSNITDTLLKYKQAIWEGLLITKDGCEIPVEIHIRLFDKDSKKYAVSTVRDIANRKQAEEALRKSEKKYYDLFENANDAIFLLDAEGAIIEANNKALELQGYFRDELIGMNIYDHIYEDNLLHFKQMVHKFKEKGRYDKFLVNVMAKDGRKLVLEISASAIKEGDKYTGARTIVRDITDRILAENALRKSEEGYRNLVENSPNIIYSYSDQRGMIYNSSRVEDILGYSAKYFLENPYLWHECIHQEEYKKIKQAIEGVSEGIHFNVQYRIKDKNDKWHWFDDKSISFHKENNETIINGLATDITEHKMLEEEIREISIRDPLTGLYNRRGFVTLAEQQLKSAKRAKTRMMLLFLDSDDLKSINDNLGHLEGDKALTDTAHILRQSFRESDIIARIGGDEFAVLTVDSSNINSKIITQRLQQNLDNFNAKKLRPYNLSLSWGAAVYDPDSEIFLDKLMSIADELMYAQKRAKQLKKL